MKLFIYHTPELTPNDDLPDCAVVIDVLRATTTIATALNSGAAAVEVFSSIEELMSESDKYLPETRIRMGERGGKTVEGCDLGNSPLDCTPEVVKGKRLFLTTTNGTRSLKTVQNANSVITASFVNYGAAVDYILQHKPETVWLVGSGWEGGYSLEDTACAGAIAKSLLSPEGIYDIGNDEVIAAIALYSQWETKLLEMFALSSHGQRLLRLNCHADLEYCAKLNTLNILPIQKEPSIIIASCDV